MAGDSVFSTVRPYLERIAFVGTDLDGEFASTGFCVLRPQPQLNPQFLFHFLVSHFMLDQVLPMQKGVSYPAVLDKEVRSCLIPVPPLDEQRRIVAILEDHLSHLDAANKGLDVANLKSRIATKQVLLTLVPDVDDYPKHWESTTVGQAGHVELGRQRHPDWHTGTNMKPYLRVANVFEDRLVLDDVMEMHWPEDSFERFRLHPGDVLLNEGQSPHLLGRPAIYRGTPPNIAFTNSLLRFKARADVLPEFALLVFRRHMHAGRFSRESRITTNIAHLSAARLKGIEFPVPPLSEQQLLVDRAEELFAGIGAGSHAIWLARRRSDSLRKSLLATAFRGDLTAEWRASQHR
jgi:type I restriction enzyme S subunit